MISYVEFFYQNQFIAHNLRKISNYKYEDRYFKFNL